MHTAFWDGEVRSGVNLRECGAYIYSQTPTTQVLCLAYAVDDGEPQLWLPGEPPPDLFREIAAEPGAWRLVAYNFEFERLILDRVLVPQHGFPPIPLEVQHCTQALALANAYPAELGLLSEALGLPYRKDPAARRAMLQVTRPRAQRQRKPGTVPAWDEDPAKLQLVYERCKLDVVTTRAVWRSPKLAPLSETERRYQLRDAIINARGVRLDRLFVAAAMELAARERIAVNLKLQELTAGVVTSVNQTARIRAAINQRGDALASVNQHAVKRALAGQPDDHVRQLLELRQLGARGAVNKFKRMLAYASPSDDRLRGTLQFNGAATGRWTGLGPQLQNLKRNESSLPLSAVDAVRAGDRATLASYGAPLALLGDLSRAALCAGPGMELISGDFSAIESVALAWLAGETWKLDAYRTYFETRDPALDPYKIIARRMLHKTADADVSDEERQLGKRAELAAGFGGSIGAWRHIAPHDPRTDDEIKIIVGQWRAADPKTRKFWGGLAQALRIAVRVGGPVPVTTPPQPPIWAAFEDGTLRLTLPSGRRIAYPQARLIPGRFEEAPPDVEFYNNAAGQWKPGRGWFGIFVENLASGVGRDLLAAAIDRCESAGVPVVFHCHDEVTIETPIGAISEPDFRATLLDAPAWAAGLPLGGKVHRGTHYLAPPEKPAEPLAAASDDEIALDALLEENLEDPGEIDNPAQVERDDDQDFVATLPDHVAPLFELVTAPTTYDDKVCCPFHAETKPSCQIYADHFHCFGCGEHGGRLDWLTRVEGLTAAEAILAIKDWSGSDEGVARNGDAAEKLALAQTLWREGEPLGGSPASAYLDDARGIDLSRLPPPRALHRTLRFHPSCPFGAGVRRPCLLALMRDPLTDAPLGIQRIALEKRAGRIEKFERRMLGKAGVVKLWPAGPALVIGEGLETTLAAATRIPFRGRALIPAWAAMSNRGMAELPPIDGVRRLIVLADHDANGAGQAAAAALAARWRAAGRRVATLTPPAPDTDFNDLVLKEDAHAAR